MKIEIAPPCSLHGLGKRTNNEDNLFPAFQTATPNDRLFLVCDGVGGSEKGEIASQITCKAIPEWYSRNRISVSDDQVVHNAVGFAKAEIEAYLRNNPGSEGMATTLTLLHLHENGATVAHIGDSRVYHIRNGKILWKTKDHSYVNNLVEAGVITETEALNHPQRNVIMRALHGKDSSSLADVNTISQLEPGDYFFLCSDGIMEGISETELTEILGAAASDKAKIDVIEKKCTELSNDNFTAYLIRMQTIENLVVELLEPDVPKKTVSNLDKDSNEDKSFFQRNGVWLLILLLITGVWLFYRKQPAVAKVTKQPVEHISIAKDTIVVKKPVKNAMKVKSKKKSKNGEISR
jgi:PPM family protein phosphatase